MKPKKFVTLIALSICTISAAVIALYVYNLGTEIIIQQTIRFGLTCFLALFLVLGSNKARWITVVLLGIGSVFSLIGGIVAFSHSQNGMILIILALLYALIVACLCSSKASAYFTHWICIRCGENNKGTDGTCWNCQLDREKEQIQTELDNA